MPISVIMVVIESLALRYKGLRPTEGIAIYGLCAVRHHGRLSFHLQSSLTALTCQIWILPRHIQGPTCCRRPRRKASPTGVLVHTRGWCALIQALRLISGIITTMISDNWYMLGHGHALRNVSGALDGSLDALTKPESHRLWRAFAGRPCIWH